MSHELSAEILGNLFRVTLLMSLMAIAVWFIFKMTRIQSPRLHRLGWGAVLLQGVIFFTIPIEVPWYEPEESPKINSKETEISRSQPEENHQILTPTFKKSSRPKTNLSGDLFTSVPDQVISSDTTEAKKKITTDYSESVILEGTKLLKGSTLVLANQKHAVTKWNLKQVLFYLWGGGVCFLLLLGISFYIFLNFLLRKTRQANESFQAELQTISREMKLKKELPLLLHDSLGPMLCLTPKGYRVVVPETLWEELPEGERRAILRHELSHYLRGDVWKSLIARLLVLPHWFNPISWWSSRRFDESAEWACDQLLSRTSPEDVPLLAKALLKVAEPSRAHSVCVSAATGAPLCTRLKRLLKNYSEEESFMKRYLVFALLLLVAGVGLFRIHLIAKEDAENEKEVVQASEAYHPDKVFSTKKKPVESKPVVDSEVDLFASKSEETTTFNPPINNKSDKFEDVVPATETDEPEFSFDLDEGVTAKESEVDLFADSKTDSGSDTFGFETETKPDGNPQGEGFDFGSETDVEDEDDDNLFDSDPEPEAGNNEYSANDNWNDVPQDSNSPYQPVTVPGPGPGLQNELEVDDRLQSRIDPGLEQAIQVLIDKAENVKPLRAVVVQRTVLEQRTGGTKSRIVNETINVSVFAEALKKASTKVQLQQIARRLMQDKRDRELSRAWEEYESSFSPQGETDVKTAEAITEMNRRILAVYHKHQNNIEKVAKELEKFKSGLNPKSDVEKLLARFLSLDNSAELIYALELNEKINANILSVKEYLDTVFEMKEDGTYHFKPSIFDDIEMEKNEFAKRLVASLKQKEEAIELLREELPRWSSEIVPKDELHQEFKKVLMDPMFAVYALKDYGDDRMEILTAHHIANLYFRDLDNQTEDTAEGLVIKSEFQKQISGQIAFFNKVGKSIGQINLVMREFKKQVKQEEPFSEYVSSWLDSESTHVYIAVVKDLNNFTIEELVQNFFREYFQKFAVSDEEEDLFTLDDESDQKKIDKLKKTNNKTSGNEQFKLQLRPDRAPMLNQKLQEWFQFNRDIRRKNRLTRALAANFEGEALKTLLESFTGTIILFEEIEKRIDLDLTDGLNMWIEEHFTEENGKLVLKPGHEKVISEVLGMNRQMYPVPDPAFNDFESNTSFKNDSGFKRTNQSNAPVYAPDNGDHYIEGTENNFDSRDDFFEERNDNAVPDYPDNSKDTFNGVPAPDFNSGSGDDFFDAGENSQPLNQSRPQPVLDGDSKPVPLKKSKDPGGSKPVPEPVENTTF